MSNYVVIHFKCQGRISCLVLKTSVEEITLSMVEARLYKKLMLDESKVKLQLSFIPLLVGCEEHMTISDDEDLCVYLTTTDKENRKCLLYVEVITILEPSDQQSRVDSGQAKQQEKVIEEDDADTSRDECVDRSDMRDKCVEPPPVVESSQFIEAWEDGLGVSVGQEFPNRKAIAELVDRVAFVNSFGYVIKSCDTTRWVVKCSLPGCKWGIRAARIPKTDIFSIRTYTKMHTCNRASHSTSNKRRKGSPQLVASLLKEDCPEKLENPTPKIIMDLVKRKFGVEISYSTALRGKNKFVRDLRASPEDDSRNVIP